MAGSVVAVDIGGTHARFALAAITPGKRPMLDRIVRYRTADHSGLESAWAAYAAEIGEALPKAASIAVAAPLGQDIVQFTNSPWMLRPATLAGELGIDRLTLLNDFGAVAHAIAWLEPSEFLHLAGPDTIPAQGVATIVGLGTGLGVVQLLRRGGRYFPIETEGAHGDFAPVDAVEDQILARMRQRFARVSDERVVCGPALANLYEALAAIGGLAIRPTDDATLWDAAISGTDPVAVNALDRLVLSFGSITGDLALQHGANQVVISGGIAGRIVDRLKAPMFHQRFCAKGRYRSRMESLPIRLVTHEQPGLLGAAAAFAEENMR